MPQKETGRSEPLRAISDLTVKFLEAWRGYWVSAGEVGDFVHEEIARRLQSGEWTVVDEADEGEYRPTPGATAAKEPALGAEPVRDMVRHILRRMALDDEIDCRLFAPAGGGRGGEFLYSCKRMAAPARK